MMKRHVMNKYMMNDKQIDKTETKNNIQST